MPYASPTPLSDRLAPHRLVAARRRVAALSCALAALAAGATTAGAEPPTPADLGLVFATRLRIVTAVAHAGVGDYESVLTIEDATSSALFARLTAERDQPTGPGLATTERVTLVTRRVVERDALLHARALEPWYRGVPGEVVDERWPGVTGFSLSRDALVDLRTRGEALLVLGTVPPEGSVDGEGRKNLGKLGMSEAQIDDLVAMKTRLAPRLRRVGSGPEPFDVLVDGQRVTLPVWRAKGVFDGRESTLAVVDDDDFPLIVAFTWDKGLAATTLGGRAESTGRVTRIETGRPPAVAAALARDGRAVLDGLYFDFGEATLRPESRATLDAASAALRGSAGAIVIAGHTDSVGDAAANLALSERRADAVRDALVARGVARARLATKGYGASRPVASNDDPLGRSLNRRVELERAVTP